MKCSLEEVEALDFVDYLGWRAFFKADKPGGPRTPEMELADANAARTYAAFYNVNRREDCPAMETRDFMEFPPEITPEQEDAEYEARVAGMGAKVDAIYKNYNAKYER